MDCICNQGNANSVNNEKAVFTYQTGKNFKDWQYPEWVKIRGKRSILHYWGGEGGIWWKGLK